ncbi:MAG: phosphatase PAP2 family protein [Dehalococcoidia bacterium]
MPETLAGAGVDVSAGANSGWQAGNHSQLARRFVIVGFVLYLAGVTAFILAHGRFPTVDYLVPALFLFAILMGRGRSFFIDWAPFVIILLAYEQARGLADTFSYKVHDQDLIEYEAALFGSPIPTLRLQEWLYTPGHVMPWDVLAALFYMLHFVTPVGVGFWIWTRDRRLYWRYILGFLGMCYAGFATYVFYPAMPPWLAARVGLLPPVHNVFGVVLRDFTPFEPFYTVYENIDHNVVAAMPSLHVAFPIFIAMTLIHLTSGRVRWLALLYPVFVTLSVVYLGHHYVIDGIAGLVYALVFYWLTWMMPEQAGRLWARLREARQPPRSVIPEVGYTLDGLEAAGEAQVRPR